MIECTEFQVEIPPTVEGFVYGSSKSSTAKTLLGIALSCLITFKLKAAGERKSDSLRSKIIYRSIIELLNLSAICFV